MILSPFSLYMDMTRLAFESNVVIGLRLMRMAGGGPHASSEARRMVLEKLETGSHVAVDNAVGLAMGKSLHAVGKKSVASYRKAVRANHRRLTRQA